MRRQTSGPTDTLTLPEITIAQEPRKKKRERKLKNVWNAEQSDIIHWTGNYLIVIFKNKGHNRKKLHYTEFNHSIELPKTKNAEAEEKLKKATFNFMVDQKYFFNVKLRLIWNSIAEKYVLSRTRYTAQPIAFLKLPISFLSSSVWFVPATELSYIKR